MSKRRWSDEQLRAAVASSTTLCEAIGKLGVVPRGANNALVKRTMAALDISTGHFKPRSMPYASRNPVRSLVSILVRGSRVTTSSLRDRLIRAGLRPAHCELCGWCERSSDGRLPLEIDHANGDRTDNRLENLRMLCPNCHSLQPTHRGLNARKPPVPKPPKRVFGVAVGATNIRTAGRKRTWSDEDLRRTLPLARNYQQVLERLGLKGSGSRGAIYRRIFELGLDTSHLGGPGWRAGCKTPQVPALPLERVLVDGRPTKSSALRKRLIFEGLKPACCALCGWASRAPDGRLPLELDHMNGKHDDNRLENLRILCPNCHALQPTHRGSNQERRKK